jgi:hypothetical protein
MKLLSKATATIAVMVVAWAVGVGTEGATPAAPAWPAGDLCSPGLAQIVGAANEHGRPAYLACLPVGERPTDGARVDLRYSAAASAATGVDVVVVCWGIRPWSQIGQITADTFGSSTAMTGGFVWDKQQVANLPGRVCRYLDAVTYGHVRGVNRGIAWAFKNLTHEAIHVTGVDNEAATECYAIQLMAKTMSLLGLGRSYANRVSRLSWSRYPRMRTIGRRYWTPRCHDHGPLDLRPHDGRWPS